MRLSLLVPVTLLGLMPLACGGSDKDAQDPSQMQGQYQGGQYPQQQGQYPQQQGQTPTTPAGTPAGGGTGGQATPIAPAAAAAATPVMTAMAQSEVAGMQPEGGAFAAQFQDGQTFEQAFNIQPGKCYSVIGVGLGLQELDIQLVAQQPPLPAVVLAQDSTTGANATLGGKGQCFKNPLPLGGPAKVILKARGQGIAIAQIYVK